MALRLYTYWRSSAAYRVRIVLALKGLAYESVPLHLLHDGGEQRRAGYLVTNPQGLVPALEHDDCVVTQSLAICEYLEEVWPQSPLLPAVAQQVAWHRLVGEALHGQGDSHAVRSRAAPVGIQPERHGASPPAPGGAQTIVIRNVSSPSMPPTRLSPRRTGPTPSGVPVKIRSPGRSS